MIFGNFNNLLSSDFYAYKISKKKNIAHIIQTFSKFNAMKR